MVTYGDNVYSLSICNFLPGYNEGTTDSLDMLAFLAEFIQLQFLIYHGDLLFAWTETIQSIRGIPDHFYFQLI